MPTETPRGASDPARAVMRWIMAALFVAAGVLHLAAPDKLLAITPSFVPFAPQLIFVTGLCEIAGALALVTRSLRWWAGVAFALYALLVWPANIKHAVEGIDLPGLPSTWWYHGPRLVLQPVIIWWALYCAEVIDWPWRQAALTTTTDAARSGEADQFALSTIDESHTDNYALRHRRSSFPAIFTQFVTRN